MVLLDLVRILGATAIETEEEDEIERRRTKDRRKTRVLQSGDIVDDEESWRRETRGNFKQVESEGGSKWELFAGEELRQFVIANNGTDR